MRTIKLVFWVLVVVTVAVFAVINMQNVGVNIDALSLEIPALAPIQAPLAFVMFLCLGAGLLVGVMLENDRGRRVRRDLRRARRDIELLTRDNGRMREALKDSDHPESARPTARPLSLPSR